MCKVCTARVKQLVHWANMKDIAPTATFVLKRPLHCGGERDFHYDAMTMPHQLHIRWLGYKCREDLGEGHDTYEHQPGGVPPGQPVIDFAEVLLSAWEHCTASNSSCTE